MSKSKNYKKNRKFFSFPKLSKKQYKVIIAVTSGVILLSLVSFALNFQSKKALTSHTMPSALPQESKIKLSPTVNPSPTETSTYVQPIPTVSSTPTPTSIPTTAEIRFIYVNKEDGNPIQANGGRVEIKANDGSFDFGKDNVVEVTVTGLKPTRHTLIMREPEGYTYYLFDLDNGNGTGFAAVNHCTVQLDPEPGRKLEARCLVKKN